MPWKGVLWGACLLSEPCEEVHFESHVDGRCSGYCLIPAWDIRQLKIGCVSSGREAEGVVIDIPFQNLSSRGPCVSHASNMNYQREREREII